MFHTADSLRKSYCYCISNAQFITYFFYVAVDCVNSLLRLRLTLSNSSPIICDPWKDFLKIICGITDNPSDITALLSRYHLLYYFIFYIIVVAEENQWGIGGIGGSFLSYSKNPYPTDRLFISFFGFMVSG